MIATSFSALLSHWQRHPFQLAMLLLGLCVATALWSGVQAINTEARTSYDRAAALIGQDRFDTLTARDGGDIDQQIYIALRRAGWRVAPVVEGNWRVEGQRLRLIGIDPVAMPADGSASTLADAGVLAEFITPPGFVQVAPSVLDALKGVEGPPLRASAGLLPGMAIADIGIAQHLLEKQGRLSRLILLPDQPMAVPSLSQVAPGLTRHKPQAGGDISRLTDSFHLNLTAFGFLAFMVGLFIVYSTVGLAFEQRRPTFRTLRSLGLSTRLLIALTLAEITGFALLAGLVGIGLGYLVAAMLMPGVAGTLNALYGSTVGGSLAFRPQWVLSGLAIAVGGALVSAVESLWRLSRLPLLAPAQPRAWAQASRRVLLLQAILAVVLLTGAAALALAGAGLLAGFAVLAGLLLGAALLWPGLLFAFVSMAGRGTVRPMVQWFWADTRQQVPGLSLAVMALLIAFAANVGVGTMVASFRATFTGWLDQRLVAELYVTARSEAEARDVAQWLKPRAGALLPIVNADAELAGQPGQVYGVADHSTYRDHWPLLQARPDVWDRLKTGEGILVNEQLFRRGQLALGDRLSLPGGAALTIAGVYSDYGNPTGQAMIGLDLFDRLFPAAQRLRFGVRVSSDAVPALLADLETEFGLGPTQVTDQAAIKRRSLAIFEQTFAVTAALNILTLGTAGIALFASMTTLSGMRLPQLAPVWAMGVRRATLARLDFLRTLLLVVATLLLAIPVGIALAWVLLAIVNVEAFGWRLPLRLFPLDWLRLAGFAVLAALVSVAVPLLRLAKITPSDLLKVFANER